MAKSKMLREAAFAAVLAALAAASPAMTGPAGPALPPWGRSAENPVRMASISGEYAYLGRLRTEDGRPTRALRRDAVFVDGFEGPLDLWSVSKGDGEYVDLWFYGYGPGNALAAPAGFRLDTAGFERELAGLPPDHVPPGSGRAWPMRPEWSPAPNGADADARGTAEVCGVRVPPPDGFAPVASPETVAGAWGAAAAGYAAPDTLRRARRDGDARLEAAAFRLDSPALHPPMMAVALVRPEGESTPGEFAERSRQIKESLYALGMRSGMRAPHRESERTLRWTVQRPVGEGFEVATCARLWVGGRSLELVCGWIHERNPAFLAGDVLGSRAAMDAWAEKILRANGETE